LKISVKQYTQNDKTIWDEFVKQSLNGTIFNYRDFLNYHIDRNFQDNSLIFYKNNSICAVLPAARIEQDNNKILFSHPGASFGGFTIKQNSYSMCDDILNAFENYCKSNDFDETFIIPAPAFYFKIPDETFEYALSWRKYTVKEHYITSVIDLREENSQLLANIYRNKNRSNSYFQNLISENHIRFEWCKHFDQFYPILQENKNRHKSKPTHSLDELIKLDQLFTGKINLLMMYSGDDPIGGTLLFTANPKVAIIFYNMINYDFSHLQPATLQVIEAIKWAKKHQFEMLDFGVSQDPNAEDPLTPSRKLIRFKEELTSRGIVRKAYSKIF
jgi:hypothetical protein